MTAGDWIKFAIALVITLGAIFGNTKLMKYYAQLAVTPISDEVKNIVTRITDLTRCVSTNKATLNRFTDNKAFYSSIDETIQDNISFLNIDKPEEDDPDSLILIKRIEDGCEYVDKFGNCIIAFFREIQQIGIDVVSYDVIKTKANRYIREAKILCISLFGDQFTNAYYKKYKNISPRYLKAICMISESSGNSKEKRFRTATMKYSEDVGNAFGNFFLTHKDLIS